MRTHKVAIVGDLHEYTTLPKEQVDQKVDFFIDLLKYQYNNEITIHFLLEPLFGLSVAQACEKHQVKTHAYLRTPLHQANDLFFESQVQEINQYCKSASGLTLCRQHTFPYNYILDQVVFAAFFHNGRTQGEVYEAIEYALSNNILAVNGQTHQLYFRDR